MLTTKLRYNEAKGQYMAKLIVIEGTDGSGKQTQAKLLADNLRAQGFKVFEQSFPNYDSPSSGPAKLYLGGHLGESATQFDAYKASSLFMVDRLCTVTMLKNKIDEADYVIFDRYVESNIIHQASKIDDEAERKKFIEWDYETEYTLFGLPKPKVVFFLNMPPEVSKKLREKRGVLKTGEKEDIHEKDLAYMQKCYDYGVYVAKLLNWQTIDCAKSGEPLSREEIADKILCNVKNLGCDNYEK